MATSHVMTGRYIPIFRPNSLIFILSSGDFFYSLPHYGNDIACHFEVVKSHGHCHAKFCYF